ERRGRRHCRAPSGTPGSHRRVAAVPVDLMITADRSSPRSQHGTPGAWLWFRARAQRRARCTATAASTVRTPAATRPGGIPPSVRRRRRARSAWRERTDPELGCESAEPALWKAHNEPADMADPIDPADANEPMLAIEAQDAALPIESTESCEQIDR